LELAHDLKELKISGKLDFNLFVNLTESLLVYDLLEQKEELNYGGILLNFHDSNIKHVFGAIC
jgi:hypothetical protein